MTLRTCAGNLLCLISLKAYIKVYVEKKVKNDFSN
jgi:hypothetical protein